MVLSVSDYFSLFICFFFDFPELDQQLRIQEGRRILGDAGLGNQRCLALRSVLNMVPTCVSHWG